MITGAGFLAKAFKQFDSSREIHIFASGVADSGNTSPKEFERERALLQTALQLRQGTLIYFSTCSIYDAALAEVPYVSHKLQMEELIRSSDHPHIIFRLSNPVGKTDNPHTLINFFVNCIQSGKKFNLWKGSFRNVLDIDDVVVLCSYCIAVSQYTNQVVNIANPVNYSVEEIVLTLEQVLNKKAIYTVTHKESIPMIDTSEVTRILDIRNMRFDNGYLRTVLEKYFGGDELQAGEN